MRAAAALFQKGVSIKPKGIKKKLSSVALAAVAVAQAEMGVTLLPETVAPLLNHWHPAPYDKDAPIFLTNPHNPLKPITIFRARAHKMMILKCK